MASRRNVCKRAGTRPFSNAFWGFDRGWVMQLPCDPSRVRAEYERRVRGKGREEGSGEQLRARLQKAKRVVARLIDAYEEGLLERGEFEPRLGRARQRLEALEAEGRAAAERAAEEDTVEA